MENKTYPVNPRFNSDKYFGCLAGRVSSGIIIVFCLVLPVWSANLSLSDQQNQSASDLSFGRLFTTPEQRKTLDEARHRGGLTRPQITGVDESPVLTPSEVNNRIIQPLKLSGVLLRADGQHQVWVSGGNGRLENPAFNHKILGDILQSANVKVPLQGVNHVAILKPGQVWIPNSQRVEESYRLATPKQAVVSELAVKPVVENLATATGSATMQTSSANEVHSSVQSSAK